MDVTDTIRSTGAVAVLRAPASRYFRAAAEVLLDAGITAIEVTLTTPNALDALAHLVREFADAAAIGAGSVLTREEATRSIAAGAGFLVSPTLQADVAEVGRASGVPYYPGALTPTELRAAVELGAPMVKLFPASAMGPEYLRSVRAPLPGLSVMPTGGIELDSVGDWLRAGADAVGLGGPLLGDALVGGDLDALRGRARWLATHIDETRNAS
jgi:2-dehydro-3-deoxyphosphogluconate aldolase / (4S)-4-hydroxy-2-oxoglutarate aldolase